MTRNHARLCPELAGGPIFIKLITSRSTLPTLPVSVLPVGIAERTFASRGPATAGAEAVHEMLVARGTAAAGGSNGRQRPGDIYVTMSTLQKAVRLGEYELAISAGQAMIGGGQSSALWRRLRTIAVEDVGLGDIDVVAFVVWLAGRPDLRDEFGSLQLAGLAIGLMCRAVKSRDMADIAYWSSLPGSIDHLMPGFGSARASELVVIASDERQPFQTRHAAARALFPARFGNIQPWRRRLPTDRMALYEALSLPPALAFAIERDVAFGGDVLTSAGPIAWALMRSSPTISAETDPFEPTGTELINGVLASSFDRHTRLGRSVLARMLRDHQPWVEFFARYKRAKPLDCVMRALFYLEGGILRPRLSYDRSTELYWSILQAKFASTGIASMDDGGCELLELVGEALPEINARRRRSVAPAINLRRRGI